jgi:hypothetical protein
VCVDKRLEPCAGGVVLNLNDVRQDGGVVWFCEKLDGGRVVVERPIEGFFGHGDRGLPRDAGGGRREACCLLSVSFDSISKDDNSAYWDQRRMSQM